MRSRRTSRTLEPAMRKRLVMAIYNRMPIGNKDLTGPRGARKHRVMFTATWAREFGVDNYHTETLEDMSDERLERAAAVVLGTGGRGARSAERRGARTGGRGRTAGRTRRDR